MSNDPQATALDRLYAKVTRRIVPLMMLGYIAAYLDRINVGFAKLQMLEDLQFSQAVYGFLVVEGSDRQIIGRIDCAFKERSNY